MLVSADGKATIVYVDGLNLYYGALRGTPHKWLNLESLFRRLRADDDIVEICYFTAEVIGRDQRERQRAYLSAIATLPSVEVILGRFKRTEVSCGVRSCSLQGQTFGKPEEKRTDVNIAVRIVADVYQDRCQRVVLVSGDSDLVPPLRHVREQFSNIEVCVYVPARKLARGAAMELRGEAHKHRQLPMNLIQRSQLPNPVDDGAGGFIRKPVSW